MSMIEHKSQTLVGLAAALREKPSAAYRIDSDEVFYKLPASDGRVWHVPATLFVSYAERVTMYTDDSGRSQVVIFRPGAEQSEDA